MTLNEQSCPRCGTNEAKGAYCTKCLYPKERKAMPITGTAYIPKVAPGIYQARVTKCEEFAPPKDPTNVFRTWEFTLTDGSGRTVNGSSSLSTTGKSKGGKWIAALIGHTLAEGETVELVGQPCTIIVSIPDGKEYESVETVAPADASNRATAAAPASIAIAAEKAAEQHAIQEGDEQTEIGVLP